MTALRDAAKSALLVWLFTTVGLFLPGMLGWINEVTQWASQKGAPPFPDPSNLGYLFVAAITAAFPAAVAGIVRYIENATGQPLLPRTAAAPVKGHAPGDRGEGSVAYLLVVAILVVVFIVVLTRVL
jgi:TRAP-type C4-dicarboxylate transport system permease small subunit